MIKMYTLIVFDDNFPSKPFELNNRPENDANTIVKHLIFL